MSLNKRIPKILVTNSADANAAAGVESQVKHLCTLNSYELRQTWQAMFSSTPPPIKSSTILLSILAWEMQARVMGGIEARVGSQLKKLAAEVHVSSSPLKQYRTGDRLSRVWKGVVYEVEVRDHGYRFQSSQFRSLSAIARRITGTRWSGPRFFGL